MLFIITVSVQHLVLCDQAVGAFSEKHFVAKLDRSQYLAALDQIRMGLKNGIDLFGSRNLLSFEHTAARLIDHSITQLTVMVDLFSELTDSEAGNRIFAARLLGLLKRASRALHHLLGDFDERPVCRGLLRPPLPHGHALNFQHPTPCRARTIVETLDNALLERRDEVPNQARDHAHNIP